MDPSARSASSYSAHFQVDRQLEDGGSPAKAGSGPSKKADPEILAKVACQFVTLRVQNITSDRVQEKEREAKKQAKAEKEQKEKNAQNKSRNMFASFFVKPKASGSGSRQASVPQDSPISTPISGSPLKKAAGFDKTFRPFTLKKDAELAPVNWFQELKSKGKRNATVSHRVEGNVIVIEDDDEREINDGDIEMEDLRPLQSKLDMGQMTAAGESLPLFAASPFPSYHM